MRKGDYARAHFSRRCSSPRHHWVWPVGEATVNGEARVVGRLPQTQIMQLDVALPLRDSAGLDECFAAMKRSLHSGAGPRLVTSTRALAEQ